MSVCVSSSGVLSPKDASEVSYRLSVAVVPNDSTELSIRSYQTRPPDRSAAGCAALNPRKDAAQEPQPARASFETLRPPQASTRNRVPSTSRFRIFPHAAAECLHVLGRESE